MKRFMNLFFVALVVGALTSVAAFAGDKVQKKTMTFTEDVMVNGTLVKAGEYEVKFDEEAGGLSIVKNGKVKAKTAARYQARSEKAKQTSLRTRTEGSNVELIGLTFGGSNQDVVVGSSGAVSGSQQ